MGLSEMGTEPSYRGAWVISEGLSPWEGAALPYSGGGRGAPSQRPPWFLAWMAPAQGHENQLAYSRIDLQGDVPSLETVPLSEPGSPCPGTEPAHLFPALLQQEALVLPSLPPLSSHKQGKRFPLPGGISTVWAPAGTKQLGRWRGGDGASHLFPETSHARKAALQSGLLRAQSTQSGKRWRVRPSCRLARAASRGGETMAGLLAKCLVHSARQAQERRREGDWPAGCSWPCTSGEWQRQAGEGGAAPLTGPATRRPTAGQMEPSILGQRLTLSQEHAVSAGPNCIWLKKGHSAPVPQGGIWTGTDTAPQQRRGRPEQQSQLPLGHPKEHLGSLSAACCWKCCISTQGT